jgi:alpha-1,2-mannosyltransferase
VLTGIAAGIKLTPAIFLVHLALTGRRREAAQGALAAAGTALVGYAVAPGDSVLFWTRLLWDPARVGDRAERPNQSLGGLVARLAGGDRALWLVLVLVTGVYGLATARAAHRHGDERWAVLVTAVTGLLVSPISWQHHWVWAVPVAIVLVERRAWAAAVPWVAVFAADPVWWPLPPGPARDLAGESVTLAGLALLAAAPCLVARRPTLSSASWNGTGSAGASPSAAPSGPAATRSRTTG